MSSYIKDELMEDIQKYVDPKTLYLNRIEELGTINEIAIMCDDFSEIVKRFQYKITGLHFGFREKILKKYPFLWPSSEKKDVRFKIIYKRYPNDLPIEMTIMVENNLNNFRWEFVKPNSMRESFLYSHSSYFRGILKMCSIDMVILCNLESCTEFVLLFGKGLVPHTILKMEEISS